MKKAFTLIELLVVIAIIAILSSVVLASLNTARIKGRDARRVTDLKQLQSALEFYYDKNGTYPIGGVGSDQVWWATGVGTGVLTPLVTQGFIAKLPIDPGLNTSASPSGSGCGGMQIYAYWSNGTQYLLAAVNESKRFTGCTQTGNWSGPSATDPVFHYYIKNY